MRENSLYIAESSNHFVRIFGLDKKVLRTLTIKIMRAFFSLASYNLFQGLSAKLLSDNEEME